MNDSTTEGFMTSLRRRARWFIPLALLALAPMSLSCYGHFPLTHAVYHMNGDAGRDVGDDKTQHKLVQSALFWVLWIIPVYQVAIFVDAVVLNLIEFWSGNTVEVSAVQEHDGTQVALKSAANGREAVLTISRDGNLLAEQHVVKVTDTSFEMRDASGNLNGMILKTPEGGIQLADAQGRVIKTLAARDLAALPR